MANGFSLGALNNADLWETDFYSFGHFAEDTKYLFGVLQISKIARSLALTGRATAIASPLFPELLARNEFD